MSTYRRIAIDQLTVDKRYQRPLEDHRVTKIAENFDATLFGVLEVARRNGKCAVFDGQHRLAAVREGKIMDSVPCLVHDGLTPEQEADLFVKLQRERKNINPRDRFRARLFYGDPVALDIAEIVERSGYEIKENAADAGPDMWRIRAVSALERVYRSWGAEHLCTTLDAVHDWWGGDKRSTDGGLIQGVAHFLKAYEGTLRGDHIAELKAVPPVTILRRANGQFQGGGSAVAVPIAQELKKAAGMRGPLPKIKPLHRDAQSSAA